ncbi:MAG TPA: hypothetical protein VHA78_02420 [Candidatus Peribacteraceae bacterium]|nr:hypothetical protein [Candidatus Peribacteraceae bacterium]
MRLRLPLLALISLILVPAAHAEQDTSWDFRDPSFQVTQQSLSSVTRGADGLHIQTNTDGFLFWQNPFVHPFDVMTLHVIQNKSATDPGLIWHPPGTPADATTQLFFHINADGNAQDIDVVPTDNPLWSWQTDQFGIGFPAGSDIVIQSITFKQYSTWEKIAEAWKSFWTFDQFRPYSINFLWGPEFTFSPTARANLFTSLPPHGMSADRLFYSIIGIAVLIGLVFFFFSPTRREGLKTGTVIVCTVFIAIWILFDLRMGSEILSYAFTDIRTYVSPPANEKTFRTHGNFYTIAHAMLPTIEKYDHYVVFEPNDSPFYANLRYMSYPSIPMHPEQDTSKVHLWVVMDRRDVQIGADHRLADGNGKILTASGHVLQDFGNGTFLFAIP